MAKRRKSTEMMVPQAPDYSQLVGEISELLDRARRSAARTVNSILTATYWEIGRRIVEFEQGGKARADYGEELLKRLSRDLTAKYGRGFSRQGLQRMRTFYVGWEIRSTPSGNFEAWAKCDVAAGGGNRICSTPLSEFAVPSEPPFLMVRAQGIFQTPSGESEASKRISPDLQGSPGILPTPSAKFGMAQSAPAKAHIRQTPSAEFDVGLTTAFPLSWSHYVRLMSVQKPQARAFYEAEAIRGGWSVRQLDRQISTQFFERTSHSKQQAAMLARGQKAKPEDAVSVQDEIRDPYLLEFLDLKDEYSESDLEDALIRHLEWFLLELGAGFTFVARQKRIRIGDVWYRIDLLLYHRGLRCLVVIDLSRGPFTHADAGQMNLYLNYVKEHLTLQDEADPVGIILCSDKHDAVVKYALGGINARVFASKYLTNLPDEETLRREIQTAQRALETRAAGRIEAHEVSR